MKQLFLIVFTIVIAGYSAYGQKLKEVQVPAATKTAFQKLYPGVPARWDKEDENYEANFKQDGKTMSAIIDKNGTIVETETMIPVSDLPASISAYMKEHYKGIKVKEAAKIVKANGDVHYEAEITHRDILFDANGKFIKEEKE